MKILSLAQGSSDWLLWRAAGLGGSDAPVIVHGRHFENTLQSLWLEKVLAIHGPQASLPQGYDFPIRRRTGKYENSSMRAGRLAEPEIRRWYQSWTGQQAAPICAVHEQIPWLKGSLDGWIDALEVILEIKRPGVRKDGSCDHDAALNGQVPDKYRPQLDHLCLVTGSRRCHYLSSCDHPRYDPLDRKVLLEYQPREEDLVALLELERQFWHSVQTITPPVQAR